MKMRWLLSLFAIFLISSQALSIREAGAPSDSNTVSDSNRITPVKKNTEVKITPNPITVPPKPLQRPHRSELWVFIACCFTFFLAGINRRINEKKHDQSVLGFLKLGMLGQAVDRSFYEFNIHQLLGLLVHNLILALWTYYFLRDTDYQLVNSSLLFFILLFFSISILYLCKFFFQYLALNILQIHDLPVLLVKCTIGLGYLATLISLPLFMVIYYVQFPEWHTLLLGLLLILSSLYIVFRTFKYLLLFSQFFGGSIFYNILYFCGLELIPLLVFIKISSSIF